MSTVGVFGVGSPAFNVTAAGISTLGAIVAAGAIAGADIKSKTMSLEGLQKHTHTISSGSSAGKTLPFKGDAGGGSSGVSGPTAGVATAATPGVPTVPLAKTNVLLNFIPPVNDTRATQEIVTMVGRFLTYEPCPEHINKGGQ